MACQRDHISLMVELERAQTQGEMDARGHYLGAPSFVQRSQSSRFILRALGHSPSTQPAKAHIGRADHVKS